MKTKKIDGVTHFKKNSERGIKDLDLIEKEMKRLKRRKKLNGFEHVKTKSFNEGDCVIRATALALDVTYNESFDMFSEFYPVDDAGGVRDRDYFRLLESKGWHFTELQKKYVSKRKLPKTPCLVLQDDHMVYINDGKLYDQYNVGSMGICGVLGYFTQEEEV